MFTMRTGNKTLQVKFHHFQEFDDEKCLIFAQTFCVLQDLDKDPQLLGEDFIYNQVHITEGCNGLCKETRRKETLAKCLQEFYPSYLENHKELRREVWFEYFNTQELARAKARHESKKNWFNRIWGILAS